MICPVESPDSYNDIVRKVRRANLPVPVCISLFELTGVEDPVNRNCPGLFRLSISCLAESHSCGAICHSSIRRGVFPSKRTDGETEDKNRFVFKLFWSAIESVLLESCVHIVVLPLHLGPSTNTPPIYLSFCFSMFSIILVL